MARAGRRNSFVILSLSKDLLSFVRHSGEEETSSFRHPDVGGTSSPQQPSVKHERGRSGRDAGRRGAWRAPNPADGGGAH
jgi:hypothetical protein